jgi:pimeloyl-ACP methyl ester carboxylesterase
MCATITCPDTLLPVPGVALLGGSGPADRHNGGLFDALRDHLVGPELRFLHTTSAASASPPGPGPPRELTSWLGDAAAAVRVLRRHPRLAADNVGVLGHSEGGWVALHLCSRLGVLRHVIVNSCPAVSFLDAEVFALTAAGVEASVAAQLYRQLGAATRAGAGIREGRRILASYQHQRWYAQTRGDFKLDADTWAQFRSWID